MITDGCRQRLEKKKRRQERDARLKAQSGTKTKPSKAAPHGSVAEEAQGQGSDVDSDDEQAKLLPQELLDEEFERAPSPTSAALKLASKRPLQKKPKTIKFTETSLKDRQVGPVKVRVLEKSNRHLAPKASAGSRNRRESWLRGRGSGKGVNAFERKPMNSGFVRA